MKSKVTPPMKGENQQLEENASVCLKATEVKNPTIRELSGTKDHVTVPTNSTLSKAEDADVQRCMTTKTVLLPTESQMDVSRPKEKRFGEIENRSTVIDCEFSNALKKLMHKKADYFEDRSNGEASVCDATGIEG